jgi:hypothetical protein
MPTETDLRLTEELGSLKAAMAERFGQVDARLAAIETELGLIRKLGDRLLAAAIAGVGTLVVWAALAAWYGSALNAKVREHDARLDRVESRLDRIDGKLDTLLARTAPRSEGSR